MLLTEGLRVSTAMEAIEYGAFRYLAKPISNDDLVSVLEQACRYHRMARVKACANELLGTDASPGDRAGLKPPSSER
ncbi:MAG: hypothetical protein U0263_39005 [Polyangiaceae bacterium]